VVIPNWNGRRWLEDCLAALERQTRPADEIIVVDNGSTDGSRELLREHAPAVQTIPLAVNLGFAAAVNIGWRAATGDAVAFLNNDTVVEPGWLAALEEALIAYPDDGFFGSRILRLDPDDRLDSVADGMTLAGFGFKDGWGEPDDGRFEEPRRITAASAAAALYRREVLEAAGGFDERFFAFEEDLDLALRAQLLGYSGRYVPEARVRHRVRATAGAHNPFVLFLCHRNTLLTVFKTFPLPVLLRALPHMLLHLSASALVHTARGQGLAFIKGVAAALWRLPGILPERRAIQRTRRISPEEFRALLDTHWIRRKRRLLQLRRSAPARG
jgi:hypothetical protein